MNTYQALSPNTVLALIAIGLFGLCVMWRAERVAARQRKQTEQRIANETHRLQQCMNDGRCLTCRRRMRRAASFYDQDRPTVVPFPKRGA